MKRVGANSLAGRKGLRLIVPLDALFYRPAGPGAAGSGRPGRFVPFGRLERIVGFPPVHLGFPHAEQRFHGHGLAFFRQASGVAHPGADLFHLSGQGRRRGNPVARVIFGRFQHDQGGFPADDAKFLAQAGDGLFVALPVAFQFRNFVCGPKAGGQGRARARVVGKLRPGRYRKGDLASAAVRPGDVQGYFHGILRGGRVNPPGQQAQGGSGGFFALWRSGGKGTARFGGKKHLALAGQGKPVNLRARAVAKQDVRALGGTGGQQVDHRQALGRVAQKGVIRLGGRRDRVQALIRGQDGQPGFVVTLPEIGQAVGKQQIFLAIRRRGPRGQIGGPVVVRFVERGLEFVPVALPHGKGPGRFGRVAQHDQPRLARAHGLEIAVQQVEFPAVIPLLAGGGSVPENGDCFRRRAPGAGRFHRHGGGEIDFSAKAHGGHASLVRQRGRQADRERALGRQAFFLHLARVQGSGGLQNKAQFAGRGLGRAVRGGDEHFQGEIVQCGGEFKRQGIRYGVAFHGQALQNAHLRPPDALRRDGIQAQLVIVALGGLQKGRVHLAADNFLKNLLAARLVHRHAFAHLALDVQGQPADGLAVQKRELQFAFQHPVVGVVKKHVQGCFREPAPDFRTHRDGLQPHRLLRVGHAQLEKEGRRGRRYRRGDSDGIGLLPGGGAGHAGKRQGGEKYSQEKAGSRKAFQADCGHTFLR